MRGDGERAIYLFQTVWMMSTIATTNLKKKIVVADDHPIVLEGMKLLFGMHDNYEISNTASSIAEVESVCEREYPDLLILDINLKGKNSLDSIERLKSRFPKLKILIFTSYDSPGMVKKATSLGVNGYMLKDSPHHEWMDAVEKVFSGGQYLSKSLTTKSPTSTEKTIIPDRFGRAQRLSARELKIIEYVVKGLKEQDIADHLQISKNTVHTHKKNIMKKLSLHSNAEIVKFAYENRIFQP